MMLTKTEKEELELLRKYAYKFIESPLQRAFFELESILEKPASNRIDSIMPSNAFRILAKAVIELKKELMK